MKKFIYGEERAHADNAISLHNLASISGSRKLETDFED